MNMEKKLPSWAIPLAIAFSVLAIGWVVWHGVVGYNAPVGQDIAVRPGMYNLQAEMQKPRNPNKQRYKDNPPAGPAGNNVGSQKP